MARKPTKKKPAKRRETAAAKRGARSTPRKAAKAPKRKPKPASTDSAPDWRKLLDVTDPVDVELLNTLASRKPEALDDLSELADLAKTPEELAQLGLLLDRLARDLPPPPNAASAEAGQRHRERSRRRQKEISEAARDIAPLPQVADAQRRHACALDFKLFCETYLRESFPLAWSDDHLRIIAKIEQAVLKGGLFALAMPRGSGKSTLCEAAVLWAVLYGHCRFVYLIHANDTKAKEALESVQTELEANDLMLADFPEVCYPIARLERIAQRAKGQLLDGRPTAMVWKGTRLILPTIAGSPSSGSIIGAAGLLKAVRGAKYRTREREIRRPDLVIIDDPQTDESAGSVDQCTKREKIVSAGVLGMAGPGKTLAAVMPCTVIERGDLADRILDREKNPHWRGERCSMLRRFPDRMELWDKWAELVREALKRDDETDPDEEDPAPQATAYIRKHFKAMHAGADLSWPERKRPWELSALHHAMSHFYRDEMAFWSEMQNQPKDPGNTDDVFATADELAVKLSGWPRLKMPPEVQWLTAFADVHARIIYWTLCAWERNFTGYVLDYGAFPKQGRDTFYHDRAKPTLAQLFEGQGQEGAIYSGLKAVADDLLGKQYTRADGVQMGVNLMLIDAGYQASTVRRFIRESQYVTRLRPSFGKGIGPNEIPISQYRVRSGEFIGDEWLIGVPTKKSAAGQAHVTFDANHWKLFTNRRLAATHGEPGALSLFGKTGSRTRHDFYAQHLCAEFGRTVEGRRKITEFAMRPGSSQNHWLDTTVGCTVAASICGARVGGQLLIRRKRRSREAHYISI